jgi:phage baseplate assembly protein W
MPLTINVAYVESSEANSVVWRDASFQNIGNTLSDYVDFTMDDVIASEGNLFIPISSNHERLKSVITRTMKPLTIITSDVSQNQYGVYLLNLSRVISRSSNPRMSIRGTWKIEFRPNYSMDSNTLYDKAAIANSITNLFKFIVGERILLPEYGNVLPRLIGINITDAQVVAAKETIEKMMGWEKRITLDSVVIEPHPDDYQLEVAIGYSIPTIKASKESINFFLQVNR